MVSDKSLDLLVQLLRIESHKDSIEIGSASKGGVVKVYGDFEDVEGFRAKLDAALALRKYAQHAMGETGP